MLPRLALAAALSMFALGGAQAGPQYVDETGFAVSGYDPVAFFDMTPAPIGQPQPQAVPGKASITAEYNGARWAFSSAANRDRFLADPAKYAPAHDGHCAYGVAQGGKVPGNPNLWRIVDGQLKLNITPTVVGLWESDIAGNVSKARENWRTLEADPASTRKWTAIDDNKPTYAVVGPIAD